MNEASFRVPSVPPAFDRLLRHRLLSHARRAIANASRGRSGRALRARGIRIGALAGLALLSSGCSKTSTAAPVGASAGSRADLLELVDVMTPLKKTVTSDITDQRFLRGRELLGKLRTAGRETGLAAMSLLREPTPDGKPRPVDVERALLDVASHAAPEDARPLLEKLVTTYGPSLELRTEATMLYAETSPAQALVILEPMVKKARPTQTQPPAEFIVKSFVTACDETGRSPVPELADVATNLYMDETARIRAVKELGHRPEPVAIQALEAILVESTGDGYLRRMAAQGLRDSLPKENACEIFRKVGDKESDLNFLQFLKDMLEKNCSSATPPR
jgi:hypothetical protein